MIIDFQAHYLPKAYLKIVDATTKIQAKERYAMFSNLVDTSERLEIMDKYGVDTQVIGSFGWPELLDSRTELLVSKASNEELASLAESHRSRFVGLATLPLQSIGDAEDELERAVSDLGLRGIWLPSNIRGKTLDSPMLYPIFERCCKHDVPIFIHPDLAYTFGDRFLAVMEEYSLSYTLGFLYDSSFSVLRFVLSGCFDKYPSLKLVMPHLGGVLPYLAGRIDQGWQRHKSPTKHAPSYYLKMIYVDTVSSFPPAFSCVRELQGSDKIVFGTDYPYWEVEDALRFVRDLQITQEEREKIFFRNSKILLHL